MHKGESKFIWSKDIQSTGATQLDSIMQKTKSNRISMKINTSKEKKSMLISRMHRGESKFI